MRFLRLISSLKLRVRPVAAAALAALIGVLGVAAPAGAGTLTSTLCAQVIAAYTQANAGLGAPTFNLSAAAQPCTVMQTGFGTNQSDLLYAGTRTVVAAGETLNLTSSLTDPFGNTLNFARVKAILVAAASTNTDNVVMGAAGSNPFLGPLGGTTPTVAVPPGGTMMVTAPPSGWTVGSAVNLKFASGGSTSIKYNLVIVGGSQ